MRFPSLLVFNISTAYALSTMGDLVLYTILPSYYPYVGLIPFQVGILLSIHRWTRLATNRIAEKVFRSYPSNLWLIFALFTGSVVTALYGLANTFIIFLGARIVWGISYSFIRQISIIVAAKAGPEGNLGERMGYYRGIGVIWIAAAVFLGGISHEHFGFRITFIALSILSLSAVPLGAVSQKDLKHLRESSLISFSGKGDYWIGFLGFAYAFVGLGMIISTVGFILKEQAGESVQVSGFSVGVVTATGIILGLRWLLMGIGSPFLGNAADRIGRELFIFFGFLIGALDLLIIGVYTKPLLLILFVLLFFACESILYTLLTAQASQRGTRSVASYVTGVDFGSALGPIIGWIIAQYCIHTKYIFILGSIIYVFGAIISLRIWLSNIRSSLAKSFHIFHSIQTMI